MKTKIFVLTAKMRMTGVAIACAALCAGCNFAPVYVKPEVQTPPTFKELNADSSGYFEGWKAAEPNDDTIRGSWWEMFREPELDTLESQATASNQSVAAAFANFLAARSVVNENRSQYFPTVTASPSVARLRQSSLLTRAGTSPTAFTATEYSLPLDASWEPDFWGRIRNTVGASTYEAQASLADLENVRLSVQAEVAADYFQLRVLDDLKEILDSSALDYRESFKQTRVQYDAGIASDEDVAQAETQLNVTLAQATDLDIQRTQIEHAIATLLGKPASSFSIPRGPLNDRPVAIPVGIPSRLLERRPDITAAERRVAEANAQIGVAKSAYFPTVTLSGSAGYLNTSLGSLFSAPGLLWSPGATLAETVFEGGKRGAVNDQVRAVYEATVAGYRQTVLTAFQEVEDNLSTLRILSQEIKQQDAAVESSQRVLAAANARYRSGVDPYLNVVSAQITLLTSKRTAMNLRMQQMIANVQLVKALGGGWAESHAIQESMR